MDFFVAVSEFLQDPAVQAWAAVSAGIVAAMIALIGKFPSRTDRVGVLLDRAGDFERRDSDPVEVGLLRSLGRVETRRILLNMCAPSSEFAFLGAGFLVVFGLFLLLSAMLVVGMVIVAAVGGDFDGVPALGVVLVYFAGVGWTALYGGVATWVSCRWRMKLRDRAAVELKLRTRSPKTWSVDRCKEVMAHRPLLSLISAWGPELVEFFEYSVGGFRESAGRGDKASVFREFFRGERHRG